jgi:hypothetical protein
MASTTRGPGAGGTEASGKNTPRKNDNKQARSETQRRNARVSTRRDYSVYDGRELLGRIVLEEATNQARAWNAAGRCLGRFNGYEAAAQAINSDAAAARRTAEALRQLAESNPPFASGLPDRF